jgi:hypothetical protein
LIITTETQGCSGQVRNICPVTDHSFCSLRQAASCCFFMIKTPVILYTPQGRVVHLRWTLQLMDPLFGGICHTPKRSNSDVFLYRRVPSEVLFWCNTTKPGNQSKRMYNKVVRKYKMKSYIVR